MIVCKIENCGGKRIGRALCRVHYDKWRRHGDPLYKRPRSFRAMYPSEASIYAGMKDRCRNPNNSSYQHYGGRGITVCPRWQKGFKYFIQDMGPRPTNKHTLERIDNQRGYGPDNCKWATYTEQIRNRRLYHINTTGHRGVSWDKQKRKWRADIKVDYKQILIGRFDTLDKAIAARLEAERRLWGFTKAPSV